MGWRLLGNVSDPKSQLVSPAEPVQARSLIFACDTPLIHPYLMLRSAEAMLAAAGLNPRGKPLVDRKVVVLATRMNDKNTYNAGRRCVMGAYKNDSILHGRHAWHQHIGRSDVIHDPLKVDFILADG